MPLRDIQIRNAKPCEKAYKLYDGGGLFVLVHPNGSRYWRLKYRYADKEKVLALGVYPKLTVAIARERAEEARALIKKGIDPVTHKHVERTRNIALALDTFETVGTEWLSKRAGRWSTSYADRVRQTLWVNIMPRLGRMPISSISAPMVIDALRPIEARGAIEQATRALRWIKAIMRYAVSTKRLERNPLSDTLAHEVLAERSAVKGHPHLEEGELGGFLRALTEYRGKHETRLAVNLLLLTVVRPGELRAAEWQEFDLKKSEWRIPAERMKMRAPHVVPLSQQAVALLEELRTLTGWSKYLFPGGRGRLPYMSENTINKAIVLMGYGGRVVGHGFRATLSTIANEAGHFSPDVIERQLAHKERNEVRAAYHRSEYLPQRRKMMQWWADHLDELRERS